MHYTVIFGSNIVQMPLWKCLFNNQIDVYKFHTMLRGRRYQTKGSKSSFRFGKGANQKPRRAHAHLIKLRQVHGTELHVYTILPAPTCILNIWCCGRVGIQSTHVGLAGQYQKCTCDLILMRAQMFFESDCKSRRLSQEVMEVWAPMDIARLVAPSLCPSSVDEQRTARRQLYARRWRKTQHKSLQISRGVQLAPLFL